MKKGNKRKIVIWCVITALAVGLAGWRLWPRSIDSFMPRPSREAVRVHCALSVFGTVNGQSVNRSYNLTAEGERESRDLMNILRRGKYQASFSNLMPWTWGSMSSGYSYDCRTINMVVMFDDAGRVPAVSMTFFGNDKASVGGRQIDPIGNGTFDELAEYIIAQGELAESQ